MIENHPQPFVPLPDEELLLTIPTSIRKNHLGMIIRVYTRTDGSSYETTEVPSTLIKGVGFSVIEKMLETWKSGEKARSVSRSRKALIQNLLSAEPPINYTKIAEQCHCTVTYVRHVRREINPERESGLKARQVISYWKSRPDATPTEVSEKVGCTQRYARLVGRTHKLIPDLSPGSDNLEPKLEQKNNLFYSAWPSRLPSISAKDTN